MKKVRRSHTNAVLRPARCLVLNLRNLFHRLQLNCKYNCSCNPSIPNINIQILLTDLYTFSYGICWEKLLNDDSNFPLVVVLLIRVAFFLDIVRKNLMHVCV